MPAFLLQLKILNTTVIFILFFFLTNTVYAATATYNFTEINNTNAGINGNPIATEHDSDIFPWAKSSDQNTSLSPSDTEYINLSESNTSEWATDDPRILDEVAIKFKFFLNEAISDITNIQIKWNGNTDGKNSSNHSIWLRKDGLDEFGGTSTWIQLGSSLSIEPDTDTNLTGNLTNDFPLYVNESTGKFEFVVTTDNDSEDMRTNYIEITVDYITSDIIAPDTVSDLASYGATENSINLTWTAPGNNENTGTATTYDLRYSTSIINDSNWVNATMATGEPKPSIAGSSESMTVSGLSQETTYYFAIKTSDEAPNISNLSNVVNLSTSEVSGIIIPASGGGVAPTNVHFSGRAYPGSKIEILRKDKINPEFRNIPIEKFYISPDGEFSITILALLQGEYFFALRAKDKEGRKTGVKSFSVNFISENHLSAKNLFLPPTLGFKKQLVVKGDNMEILGYSASNNEVEVQIDGKKTGEVKSNNLGQYTFLYNTSNLKNGTHSVRIRQKDKEGILSDFSITRIFKITELRTPGADFNNDNAVNITDWSIFLFRWGSSDSNVRFKVDMNNNGKIDISDFSIFLRAMHN